jgi:hypothetical protein
MGTPWVCAVQISIDEDLLRRLDADPDVRRLGRSAVMRRAGAAYLHERRARDIAEAYRAGYGQDHGIDAEFTGWGEEGQWPED